MPGHPKRTVITYQYIEYAEVVFYYLKKCRKQEKTKLDKQILYYN